MKDERGIHWQSYVLTKKSIGRAMSNKEELALPIEFLLKLKISNTGSWKKWVKGLEING